MTPGLELLYQRVNTSTRIVSSSTTFENKQMKNIAHFLYRLRHRQNAVSSNRGRIDYCKGQNRRPQRVESTLKPLHLAFRLVVFKYMFIPTRSFLIEIKHSI